MSMKLESVRTDAYHPKNFKHRIANSRFLKILKQILHFNRSHCEICTNEG